MQNRYLFDTIVGSQSESEQRTGNSISQKVASDRGVLGALRENITNITNGTGRQLSAIASKITPTMTPKREQIIADAITLGIPTAAVGGLVGHFGSAKNNPKRKRNTIIGSLIGGGVGAATGGDLTGNLLGIHPSSVEKAFRNLDF